MQRPVGGGGPEQAGRFPGTATQPLRPNHVESIVNRSANDLAVSDAKLVARAQGGDAAAFAALVSKYQDRVYNTCYRMCHNRADALDLTQSAFLKALEALPDFQARASFFTWLFRIAVNQVISQRRTQLRRRTGSLSRSDGRPAPPEPAGAAHADPARRIENRELRARLEAALLRLDEEFRVAVVLKDVEDMDYATIAQVLELPVGTVKSRIHRGRLMLREMLAQEETHRGRASV